jgi:hypothetical protein
MEVEMAYEYTSSVMVENLLYSETNQGINAFIDKQEQPKWT